MKPNDTPPPSAPQEANNAAGVGCMARLVRQFDCQRCGACCAYSNSWPEIWSGDEIPDMMLSDDGEYMRCHGDRCCALRGVPGRKVKCSIYDTRPAVCKQFEPGSNACTMARKYFNLPNTQGDTSP